MGHGDSGWFAAGGTAGVGGPWNEAEAHCQTALHQAHELPHRIAQPEVRRWYARILIDRTGGRSAAPTSSISRSSSRPWAAAS